MTAENSNKVVEKLDRVHGLVNGRMTEQQRMNATLARKVAELTGDPGDLRIADEAEKRLEAQLREAAGGS